MFLYTMTFVSRETLGLPPDADSRSEFITGIVAEKLSKHEFELADFNWSGNYSLDNSLSYLNEPYKLNAVVEVRVKLNFSVIHDKIAIYDSCINAVKNNYVILSGIKYPNSGFTDRCVICFDLNSAA